MGVYEEITSIYPLSVAKEILGELDARRTSVEGLMLEIAKLEENQSKILSLRYRDKKTYKECAEILGVSPGKASAIERRALRLLKHPTKTRRYMTVSYAEYFDLKRRYEELAENYELIKKALQSDPQIEVNEATIMRKVEINNLLDSPIETLGLSSRAYNCLRRAGKKTIKDVALMSISELQSIRNMGSKSVYEVESALEEKGVKLKEE